MCPEHANETSYFEGDAMSVVDKVIECQSNHTWVTNPEDIPRCVRESLSHLYSYIILEQHLSKMFLDRVHT